MLVDVDIPHDSFHPVLAAVSGGKRTRKLPEIGCYLAYHWNIDLMLGKRVIEEYPEFDFREPGIYGTRMPPADKDGCVTFDAIGVCDSPQQLLEKFGKQIRADKRNFIISFVEIRKDQQSSTGGWRWHKWGSYVGEHDPQYEYLYDEPKIDVVYTYHIYEVSK